MLITKHTEIIIYNIPEAIWDYASDPVNWSASNPEEHFGLNIDSEDNRPKTGATFHQKETVAGLFADLRGHFLYVEKPRITVWRGITTYKVLGGLIRPGIPEGGVIKIENLNGSCRVSHDVYMDFPDTLFGKIMLLYFKKFLGGEKAVYDHTYRELVFFKKHLDLDLAGVV